MGTDQELKLNKTDSRLQEIGAIFEGMGITTVELALLLRNHITNCPGGKSCLDKLLSGVQGEKI